MVKLLLYASHGSLPRGPEKGLPFYKAPFKFGNLFVKFTVTFPDKIAVNKLPALKGALP